MSFYQKNVYTKKNLDKNWINSLSRAIFSTQNRNFLIFLCELDQKLNICVKSSKFLQFVRNLSSICVTINWAWTLYYYYRCTNLFKWFTIFHCVYLIHWLRHNNFSIWMITTSPLWAHKQQIVINMWKIKLNNKTTMLKMALHTNASISLMIIIIGRKFMDGKTARLSLFDDNVMLLRSVIFAHTNTKLWENFCIVI